MWSRTGKDSSKFYFENELLRTYTGEFNEKGEFHGYGVLTTYYIPISERILSSKAAFSGPEGKFVSIMAQLNTGDSAVPMRAGPTLRTAIVTEMRDSSARPVFQSFFKMHEASGEAVRFSGGFHENKFHGAGVVEFIGKPGGYRATFSHGIRMRIDDYI